MSLADPAGKLERIEEFLRKSLLGEELINTQFHLFSARTKPPSRLTKPRVLCANNALLAKSSKYFLDLLGSDVNPSDGSLSDLTDANDVPSHARIDDYGYGSDSDLDEDDEPVSLADTEAPKKASSTTSKTPSRISIITQPKDDDELSEDGSESVSSDMFVMSPEHPRAEDLFGTFNTGEATSVTSGETAVHKSQSNKTFGNQTAMRLRSLGSRHILVKDTAFQTWYTLLNYLYTDRINFLPLSSATPPRGQLHKSSVDSLDEPKCSAKSMYRLACKVGLDHLRDEALAHIQSNLTENNILKELSFSIVSRHPQLLEMELDVLYAHIGSAPVVAGFPAFARRIAQKELAHGADVILGVHARLLKERHPLPLEPTSPMSPDILTSPPRSPRHSLVAPAPPPPHHSTVPQPQPLARPSHHFVAGFAPPPPPPPCYPTITLAPPPPPRSPPQPTIILAPSPPRSPPRPIATFSNGTTGNEPSTITLQGPSSHIFLPTSASLGTPPPFTDLAVGAEAPTCAGVFSESQLSESESVRGLSQVKKAKSEKNMAGAGKKKKKM